MSSSDSDDDFMVGCDAALDLCDYMDTIGFMPTMNPMDLVEPGLWLGNVTAAANRSMLAGHGITHVLTVGSGLAADVRAQWGLPAATTVDEGPGPFKSLLVVRDFDPISCLRLEVLDLPETNLMAQFTECNSFIGDAIAEGGQVLVHCQWGMSRSATLVVAYICTRDRSDVDEVLEGLVKVRPVVNPTEPGGLNSGFLEQLRAWKRAGFCEPETAKTEVG